MEQILLELPCDGSLPLLVSTEFIFYFGKGGSYLANLTLFSVKYKN